MLIHNIDDSGFRYFGFEVFNFMNFGFEMYNFENLVWEYLFKLNKYCLKFCKQVHILITSLL